VKDIRWHQRLNNFSFALNQLSSAVELSRLRPEIEKVIISGVWGRFFIRRGELATMPHLPPDELAF
jgi:hypothetical protein